LDDEKIKQDKLRKIAEETVNKQFNHATNHLKSEDDIAHELRVHQVELEMQNEELKKAQIKLRILDANILIYTTLHQTDT